MTKRDRLSATGSSDSVGRCAINMTVLPSPWNPLFDPTEPGPHPAVRAMAAQRVQAARVLRWCPLTSSGPRLLAVQLDDQLLLDVDDNLLADRQLMDEDSAALRDDLHPARHLALVVGLPVDDMRRQLTDLRSQVDDVVGADPVRGDVHLLAVDDEVAVHHKLTGLPSRPSQTRPVHDVVQPRLEDRQQVVTRLALQPVGFLVVAAELLLQHAVGESSLLLLPELQRVLRLLGATFAVHAGWVRTPLERRVAANQVNTQPTRLLGHGTGIASHVSIRPCLWVFRRDAAWAGDSRCAVRA